jgi:hypothetical protein
MTGFFQATVQPTAFADLDITSHVQKCSREAGDGVSAAGAHDCAPKQRCAAPTNQACFDATLSFDLESEGSATNDGACDSGPVSGSWTYSESWRSLRSFRMLVVRRVHGGIVIGVPHKGGPVYGPASLVKSMQSTMLAGPQFAVCSPAEAPTPDCGARSFDGFEAGLGGTYPESGVIVTNRFVNGVDENRPIWHACQDEVIGSKSADEERYGTLLREDFRSQHLPLRRFFEHRRLELGGGGTATLHGSHGQLSTTIHWSATLIPVAEPKRR